MAVVIQEGGVADMMEIPEIALFEVRLVCVCWDRIRCVVSKWLLENDV